MRTERKRKKRGQRGAKEKEHTHTSVEHAHAIFKRHKSDNHSDWFGDTIHVTIDYATPTVYGGTYENYMKIITKFN